MVGGWVHGKEHTGMGKRTYVSDEQERGKEEEITWEIDWPQSLKHFVIDTCSQSNSDGSVFKMEPSE